MYKYVWLITHIFSFWLLAGGICLSWLSRVAGLQLASWLIRWHCKATLAIRSLLRVANSKRIEHPSWQKNIFVTSRSGFWRSTAPDGEKQTYGKVGPLFPCHKIFEQIFLFQRMQKVDSFEDKGIFSNISISPLFCSCLSRTEVHLPSGGPSKASNWQAWIGQDVPRELWGTPGGEKRGRTIDVCGMFKNKHSI